MVVLAYDRLDSTNRLLKRYLEERKQLPEGTLVVAWEQTAGYGQNQRSWYAKKGESLTFSILLYPHFVKPEEQSYLLFCIASTVAGFLRDYAHAPVFVKWPNDLYLLGKKVGGILIENTIQREEIGSSVVGIGINVNNRAFPPELEPIAISLFQATGRCFSLEPLLSSLHQKIMENYEQMRNGRKSFFYALYQTLLLPNHKIAFEDCRAKQVRRGEILQVLPSGELKIRLETSEIKCYGPGEIRTLSVTE